MGRPSKKKLERRGKRKARHVAAAQRRPRGRASRDERELEARQRHLEASGCWGRVQAVRALTLSPAFGVALRAAIDAADAGPTPPKNEEDVRSLALEVLRGDAFKADLTDVLLKVFIYKAAETPCHGCVELGRRPSIRESHFHVMAIPGVEASRAAAAAARAELGPPKLSASRAAAP